MKAPARRPEPALWAVAAAILIWLGATAWMRPLMLPDEGRYVGVAWEMMRSGEWLTPTLDGLPFFHKPPLFYWITSASMSLFGVETWAARAAPLFGASMGAFALYLFARRWSGPAIARQALLVLLVQPLFYVGGQFANLDMLVAGCISATVVLLAHASLNAHQGLPPGRPLAGAYAAAALGVLAKGLIGFVVPGLVIVVWLVLLGRARIIRALLWWPGFLLFAVLALPWFVAMQARYADFLDYFFVVQHFKRFAASGFNNVQPFWFYPAVLLAFSLPWLRWLAESFKRGRLADPEQGPIRLLMGVWAAVVVLFFSLPSSKLIGYVLPAVPPLAWLIADGHAALVARAQQAGRRSLWPVSLAIGALVSVGSVVALTVYPVHSSKELALALRAERGPQQPIYMLNGYYYDVPFYAGLDAPVTVLDDWQADDVFTRDNWRKELADAGRFSAERASASLMEAASLGRSLCLAPVSWVMGPQKSSATRPYLARSRVVGTADGSTLWRVDTGDTDTAKALGCPETPNAGSTGM